MSDERLEAAAAASAAAVTSISPSALMVAEMLAEVESAIACMFWRV